MTSFFSPPLCSKCMLSLSLVPHTDCKSPTFGNGTMVGVGVGVEAVEGGWSAVVTKVEEKAVTLTVISHIIIFSK